MKTKEPSQKLLGFLLSFMLSYLAIMASINAICNLIISEGFIYDTMLIFILFFAVFVLAAMRYMRTVQIDVLIALIVYAALLMISYSIDSRTEYFFWTSAADVLYNPTYLFLLFSFGGYAFSRRMTDCKEFLRYFEGFSIAVVVLSLIQYNIGMNNEDVTTQYMAFSYNMLMQVIFLFILSIRKPKWYRVLFAIVGALLLILAGCRGAVLALAICVALYVLFFKQFKGSRTKIVVVLSIITGLLLLMLLWEPILNALAGMLDGMGISSRNITILLEGNVLDDSGRSEYLTTVRNHINPLYGNSLYSDRILLRGHYAHNIFYEILYDFGLLFGLLVIIGFGWLYFSGFRTKNQDIKMLLVLFTAGVIKLLFSSSFLAQEPALYILLGLCTNVRLGYYTQPVLEAPMERRMTKDKKRKKPPAANTQTQDDTAELTITYDDKRPDHSN